MGSIIDRIIEEAPTMGDFTTRQMAFRIFGELNDANIARVGEKLRRLANQGYVVRVAMVRMGYAQKQAIWRSA